MAHSSQNQNPIHQSATAGFQPESLGLQSPFDGHSFNSMPANGMASRSAGAPATLNISTQADSTQIDVNFAGDNLDAQNPFSMKLNGLGLGNPTEWAQGLRQVGNAVSSWLQRVSGEIVGANVNNSSSGSSLANSFSGQGLSNSKFPNFAESLNLSSQTGSSDRLKPTYQPANVFLDNPSQLSSFTPDARPASISLPDGIKTKPEVNIDSLVPEMQAILPDIAQAYKDSGTGFSPLISSGNDSKHGRNSAHYKDMAIDLSSHDADYSDYMTANDIKAIAQEITDSPLKSTPVSGDPGRLQSNWDKDGDGTRDYTVIVEHPGVRGRQHIHIELEPKHSISSSDINAPSSSSNSNNKTNLESSPFSGTLFQYKENQTLKRDPNVQAWQQQMRDRGWNIAVDGFYGPESQRVATQFQIEKRLRVDGIVGPETWHAAFDWSNHTTPAIGNPENSTDLSEIKPLANQDVISALRAAIIGQESGGDFQAVNPDSGALGIGQVMPKNIPSWSREALGYELSPKEFLASPDKQLQIIDHKLNQYYQNAISKTSGNTNLAVRRVASAWYSGNPEKYNSPVPQGGYPSISSYTSSILSKFKDELNLSNLDSSTTLASNESSSERFDPIITTGTGNLEIISGDSVNVTSESGDFLNYQDGLNTKSEVQHWQEFLNGEVEEWKKTQNGSKGVPDKILEDGDFGPKTANLTAEYQRRNRLSDDGILGPKTLEEAIKDGFSPPLSDGTVTLNGDSRQVKIRQYDAQGRTFPGDIDPAKETVIVSHGWKAGDNSDNISELAKEISKSNDVQVLAIDWSSISQAKFDMDGPPPEQTAKWITPVAEYVHSQLDKMGVSPEKLTLVGHSLGTYVSSEIAAQFGKVKNIVALDPAFPGKQRRITSRIPGLSKYNFDQKYDLDGRDPDQDLPKDFRDVADNSLALVTKNSDGIGGGLAGDNDMAATANTSFIVDFSRDFAVGDQLDKVIANNHNNVVNTFTNALQRDFLELPDLTLPKLESNWYSDNGTRINPFIRRANPIGDLDQQEGRITVEPTLSPDQTWRKPDHPNSTGNPVHITGLTRVVDASGKEKTTWT